MNEEARNKDCVFCRAIASQDGPENLIVWRGKHAFIILNLYPYTSGHAMVVPYEHINTIEELPQETRAEMMELIAALMKSLRAIYHPDAFNFGANIGAAAGAGIAEHVHLHVVPRWNGDTNFMSTVAKVRVIPETPEETHRKLHDQLVADLGC